VDSTGHQRRLTRTLATALAAAFIVRVLFAFLYWVDKPLTHDELEYLSLARNLSEGHGFTYDMHEPASSQPERFGRAPLYPFFLSMVARVTSGATLVPAIKIAQAGLGAMTVLLVALVARRAGGDRAAAWAAWIGALYPPLAWMSSYMLSETLYTVLAFASVVALSRVLDDQGQDATAARGGRPSDPREESGWQLGLLAGIVGGLAALTRPAHLLFLMLAGLWLLWKRGRSLAVVLAIGAAVVIGPWTLRNYRAYGRLVLIASEGGITFWTGNHALSPGEGDMAANPAIKLDNQRLRFLHPGLSPEELESVYYREAMAAITANPAWWIGLEFKKLFYLWVPIGPSYMLHSRLFRIASWVSYGLLVVPGLAGLVALWRRRTGPPALWLLLASAVLACLIFFPQERFRIPVVDPALIIGAAMLATPRGAALARMPVS
jgi:4-amino-4-deoxy-L-arabinose transferase-like glycosyltransferase